VLGIKSTTSQARLLKELFAQLASLAIIEKQIGIFIPTSAVHLLGAANYIKLICVNNQFLQSVMMILVGDFQHATLKIPFSIDSLTNIDQITLLEFIAEQAWCLSIEKTTTQNKVLLTRMKQSLKQACAWIDNMLPGYLIDFWKRYISYLHQQS